MHTRHLRTLSFIPRRSIGSDRWRLLALLVPGLLLAACSDDGAAPDATGATGGAAPGGVSGGSGGTSGSEASASGGASGSASLGSGGSSGAMSGGIMDNPEFGFKVPCPPPAQALILDFSSTTGGDGPSADAGSADAGSADAAAEPVRDATFGAFGISLAGGTYSYPGDGTWPIGSDVAQGNWHLTGDVGTYSGFGIYIAGCNVLDASAFDGISFTVSGSVAMGGALSMNVGTSANDVSHVWLNTVAVPPPATPAGVNSGRCIPASTNQYDGSCASATFPVPVTAEPTTVTVLWSQLTGGLPSAGVDPTEITGISWTLPAPPGAGDPVNAMPYAIDIVIDDIGFVDNP